MRPIQTIRERDFHECLRMKNRKFSRSIGHDGKVYRQRLAEQQRPSICYQRDCSLKA